jgi:2-phospho-L-lactate/phosphoenolpyruvate guanylyltransferase
MPTPQTSSTDQPRSGRDRPNPDDLRAVHPGPAAHPVSSVTEPGGRIDGWTVILPLKGGPAAKSRLGAPAALATAIALDCLAAVLAAERVNEVVVVTPDPLLATEALAAGARVQPESRPGAGLPAAVGDGLHAVLGRCAVLLGDLPALRAEDLGTALRLADDRLSGAAGPPMVFVPDAEGTGTVLLTALTPAAMRPSFGPGSAQAHQNAGALRMDVELPRLRRDVDTPADLRTAIEFGVGPRTTAVLAAISV